ncbi:MAG: CIA30 family protein, partial [Planctomycetota bacterium]
LGEMSIDPGGEGGAGILTMTGDINLNGGGFTSVLMDASGRGDEADARLPDFAGVRGIRFRVRASDQPHHRPWRLRVEDDLPRRRGINFRGLMTFNIAVPANQWQTVTVWLQHLRPTASGRELDPAAWEPLDVSRIRRLGVVLNDTGAGPYELQIERIELIR